MTFRALGFLLAVNQRFELVMTLFADVFKDGHGSLRSQITSGKTSQMWCASLLESICGNFAISWGADSGFARVGVPSIPSTSLAAGRACADDRQLPDGATNSFARA